MLIGIIVGVVVVIVTWICIAIRQQERKALESQQREIKKIRERNEQERKKLESRQREIEKKLESRQREIEKKLESRQREIEKTMKILKGCEQVDLCFMVDCTDSMQSWIDSIKSGIQNLADRLHATYTSCNLRVAFVGYTDFDQQESTRIKRLDFTQSVKEFKEFVSGICAEGGDDNAEDVMGGLKVVTKLSWRDGVLTKVLIHIADAPCHGKEYYDGVVRDNHPNGDPEGISHWTMMSELVRRDIQYWFGHIQKDYTKKMIEVFNQSWMQLSQQTMIINEFEAVKPEEVTEAVFDSVCASIATIAALHGRRSIRPFTLDQSPPDIRKSEDFPSATRLETIPEDEEDVPSDTRVSSSVLSANPIKFKATHPFGIGTSHLVYYAFNENCKMSTVLKESLFESDTREYYDDLVKVLWVAKQYGKQFNKVKPSHASTIDFQDAEVVSVPSDTGEKYYLCEPYLSGKYEIFNTTNGWFTPKKSTFTETIQAFSHFSWIKSEKQLLICDLQGIRVESENRLILTGPAIHHRHKLLKCGRKNLGYPGIQEFFKKHMCNDICNKMKLQPFHHSVD